MNNKGFSLISVIVSLMIFSIVLPVSARFFFSSLKTCNLTHHRINQETEWIMISHYLYDLLHTSTIISHVSPNNISLQSESNQRYIIAYREKGLGIKKMSSSYTYLNSVLAIKDTHFRYISSHLICLSFDTDLGAKHIYVHI